jgi:hypothetical protein
MDTYNGDATLAWVLARMRYRRSILPELGRDLIDTMGIEIAQYRKRHGRHEDWRDSLVEAVEVSATWLTPEQIERIRAAIG